MKRKAAIMAALASAVAAAALAAPAIARATTTPTRAAAPAGFTIQPPAAPALPLLGQAHGIPLAGNQAATTTPAPIPSPLTPSQCRMRFGFPCYDGSRLREIYGLTQHDEGRGAVIGLIMPYHNPVAAHDLRVYARQAGLGAPNLHITEIGHPVTASPANVAQAAAEMEETLDLDMLYAMAPKARINLYETQADFSLSPLGFSYYANVLKWVAAQRPRVDVVSLSMGWAEGNYAEAAGSVPAGDAAMRQQAAMLNASIRAGVTLTVATGDTGSAGINLAGTGLYPQPTVYFPASDPVVVGASGTEVSASDAGHRISPDVVWSNQGDNGATGGGLSSVFPRPSWQNPYSGVTGNHRGVGDVSMDGATGSPIWIYSSEYDLFSNEAPGWMFVAGTSASAPMFTGVVADAAAIAGHRLGDIHPALYRLAQHPVASGIERVTSGCNTDYGVAGFCAGPGPYSLPDGVGTVGNGDLFIHRLALAA